MRAFRLMAAGVAMAGAIAAATGAAAAHPVSRQETLVVGRISADPKGTMPRLDAFAGYLAVRLAGAGVRAADAVVAADACEMIDLFAEGKVDVVSESLMTALYLEEHAPAEIFLHELKQDSAHYRTVMFTRADSPVAAVDDLRGRRIAFEDRGSTTAFLLPLAVFRAHGLAAVELPSPDTEVPPGTVGYVFAGNELNISMWVDRGRVDAGAFSDQDWTSPDRNPERVRQELRIFFASKPVLRSLVLVRRGLRPAVRDRLADVLLGMESDPASADVRHLFYKVGGYRPIEGETAANLDDARWIYALVKDEISE